VARGKDSTAENRCGSDHNLKNGPEPGRQEVSQQAKQTQILYCLSMTTFRLSLSPCSTFIGLLALLLSHPPSLPPSLPLSPFPLHIRSCIKHPRPFKST
jgi:hypothetical protein